MTERDHLERAVAALGDEHATAPRAPRMTADIRDAAVERARARVERKEGGAQ